jgi:glucosamine--fructose-6-phosphate aminotransferase (isomerizing)
MCGIVGYVGAKNPVPILLEGLERLEYRGYDSAGIAVLSQGKLERFRCAGKIQNLKRCVEDLIFEGGAGIGHTRWATHGHPTEVNAHPHIVDGIAVVHNGIVENHKELAAELRAQGCVFSSETDTEVIAHLVARARRHCPSLREAVRQALRQIRGSYALAVLAEDTPETIIVARQDSPLVIGLGEQENFVASDVAALLGFTPSVVFLENEELATITPDSIEVERLDGTPVQREPRFVEWDREEVELGFYPHYMLKEIHEQPTSLIRTIKDRLNLFTGEVTLEDKVESLLLSRSLERIVCVACGTSYYASLVGEWLVEELARLPVEVELASEFRYRNPVVAPGTLVIAVSQSGETADTLGALREAQRLGGRTLAITNVRGSTLAREADAVLEMHAGPEIGVASTKAFTCQLAAFALLALKLATHRRATEPRDLQAFARSLHALPAALAQTLALEQAMQAMAERFSQATNFLYLGRGPLFPVALEGALKLKEVSYIHAEGCPAGEIKHGPIALVDTTMPVIVLAQRDRVYEKILSNMEEIRSRGGMILALTDTSVPSLGSRVLEHHYFPETHWLLAPFLAVVPLQLFAYYVAVRRGLDVDKPRNLAKSVTVE